MGGGYLDAAPLVRIIRGGGYLNKQLQAICVGEGLGKVGVKADLQNRIIDSTSTHTSMSIWQPHLRGRHDSSFHQHVPFLTTMLIITPHRNTETRRQQRRREI